MTIEKKIETQLPIILREFMQEIGAAGAQRTINLEAHLERDLGLGSLERAAFFPRVEKSFGASLPESLLAEVRTLNDLIAPIQQSHPMHAFRIDAFKAEVEDVASVPVQAETLVDVLRHHCDHVPKKPHIFLQDAHGIETTITYEKLFASAQSIACGLISHGIKPGETIAIMLPTSEAFFYTFFGILLLGAIPVPIYPPFRPDQIGSYVKREAAIFRNAEIRVLVTFDQAKRLSKLLADFIPSLKAVTTFEALQVHDAPLLDMEITAEDPALIQYTSGSTGDPKGVLLTHRNLLANIRAYGERLQIKPSDVVVSWLPLYHDMGLIGAWLGSLYYGVPLTILSPITFLLYPERWLRAIHYHRATLSAGPNFAYELCVRRLDEQALQGLDLSSWRLALNGAEAIHPNTLRSFSEKFSRYGFKAEAMFPVYGLAECSVALSFPKIGRKFLIDRIDREKFMKQQIAVKVTDERVAAMEFVCCGQPLSGHEIRIVGDDGKPVAERIVGEVQFKGPSAMQAYYHNPEATQAIYHEGWWDTGDYGYLVEGEIYISGRKKDIIVKAGRNLLPESAEALVAEVAGVRRGCVAVFGVEDKISGTEKLIVVAETRETQTRERKRIMTEINQKVSEALGVPPDEVILARPKTIPKTSSGKLRRSTCKDSFLQGKLAKRKPPVWLQLTQLFGASLMRKFKKWRGRSARFIFSIYIVFLMLTTLPIMWLLGILLAKKPTAKIIRAYARAFLLLCGSPVKITGREHLANDPPIIFVANHTSYLDVFVLLAVLPIDVAFIGKQELWKVPLLNTYLNKLEHIPLDRSELSKSIDDFEQVKKSLQAKRSVCIFPEGTFTYAKGLRPFKLGAFKLAAETDLPICPVAIQGTRTVLRSDAYLPRPGKIQVTLFALQKSQGHDLPEIIRLSTEARAVIAKHCGESAVDLIVAGIQAGP
ncbi:MAG: 1-acylglycerol-3-phosphate O-acyltransferase [Gammaproteobacteria bacterium]